MPEDKYEELKRVIQEAVPEIMELKFGCEIKRFFNTCSTRCKCNFEVGVCVDDSEKDAVHYYKYPEPPTYINEREYENLGRPIRLADILLALQRKGKPCLVDAVGIFYDLKTKPLNIGKAYDLDHDNLDNQSNETKEFLYNLLIK